jgi:hypothetical protein
LRARASDTRWLAVASSRGAAAVGACTGVSSEALLRTVFYRHMD